MKRPKVFAWRAVGIPSVIEPDRTDRQFVTQAAAERVSHIVHPRLFGSGKKIAGIKEECALQLAVNRERVLDIEDGVEFAADRISLRIMWAKVALAKTSDRSCATVEEALIDRQRGWFVRTRMVQRMN